ncbi:hypothetical protein AGABI2DRAFT_118431 [Agaricus bisporus var. bisporus H97]|uniref:hypothetical protein n=1 Tax=Agaricus bisporus var. bisporus (strain H97 / ATCC MYA-4626 / FGSC 10389) TaxID=936046 RepID=UPI00029F7384|nr:hypothetical protein AGABI2DRAFT_118431 [Agaricus bisporus var. bisporus H97]EKV46228.1 hypothetical protein AGABI2DRAFT_118431 [Agaricus bisporus var. bisporus H97]
MSVPEPGDAAETRLHFYHASFQDFLLDPNRSGRFLIGEYKAQVIFLQSLIYWLEVDATHFHTLDGWNFDYGHTHDSLPGLTWASEDNRLRLSESITRLLERVSFDRLMEMQWDGVDDGLLAQLSNVDFRYWMSVRLYIIAALCRLTYQLQLCGLSRNGVAKPARFPLTYYLPEDTWSRKFFFLGQGLRSVITWRTKSVGSNIGIMHSLRSDQEPTEAQISKYRDDIDRWGWNEEEAVLAMG